MKGDFTRSTFDPRKHYSSVRMQQGRVQLDADWNEQMDILGHRDETEAVDVIGRCGFPMHAAGFKIKAVTGDLLIGPGRGYVDGILCELEAWPRVEIESFAGSEIFMAPGALEGVALAPSDWLEILDETGTLLDRKCVQSVDETVPKVVCTSPIGSLGPGILSFRRLTTFTTQPYLPDMPDLLPEKILEGSEIVGGIYFAYLDVWRRHVTAVEDPALREAALGGPDTATRLQTIWQVRLLKVGDTSDSLTCESEPELWKGAIAPPTGKLRARSQPAAPSDDPCIVPASAGYTRLENQLYRVEVHKGGTLPPLSEATEPSFKWSRDNGSIATEWLSLDQDADKLTLTVWSTGRDSVLRFEEGGWIELIDDACELRGEPGLMQLVDRIEGNVIEIPAHDHAAVEAAFAPGCKIRRWDSAGPLAIKTANDNEGYLALEAGIEIRFEAGSYRTGDYWLIPARAFVGAFSGDIEWPRDGETPLALPPHGIHHHYCKLAVMEFTEGFEKVSDCRDIFPPLTELIHLVHVGGDGQEAFPGQPLLCPLEVGVTNGQWPVSDARVKFEVSTGGGTLSIPEELPSLPGTTLTGDDGIARCSWTLPNDYPNGTPECLTVTATLRDGADHPVSIPIVFHARLIPPQEKDKDKELGITVEKVFTRFSTDEEIYNDSEVPLPYLTNGLNVKCSQQVDDSFSPPPASWKLPAPARPNVQVILYLPYPLEADSSYKDIGGFQPLLLAGWTSVTGEGSTIRWEPTGMCTDWLSDLESNLFKANRFDRLLVQLILKGNFIWGGDLFLDGEAFGKNSSRDILGNDRIGLKLPSGDGRKSGDFEMWFWVGPNLELNVSVTPNNKVFSVAGFVLFPVEKVGVMGTTLTLASSRSMEQPQTAITDANGHFIFPNVTPGQYIVTATAPSSGVTRKKEIVVEQRSGREKAKRR